MFRAIAPTEAFLQRFPTVWRLLNRHGPAPEPVNDALSNHVVVVGYGRVGQHIVTVLRRLEIPHLVVDMDATRIEALEKVGVLTLFGDAANSDLLSHAKLDKARLLVVTLPDETAAEMVVSAARQLAPDLAIIVRAATTSGITHLTELGAQDVIHPELEGGLEIVRYSLLRLGFPFSEVGRYTDAVRRDHYDTSISSPEEQQLLDQLTSAVRDIDVVWVKLEPDSAVVGQTIMQANLRADTGASIIAIARDGHMLANPKSATVFQAGDQVGLIGETEQVAEAQHLLTQARVAENVPPPLA
jgi:monovalent cation:H+ antiporter-2, CPA2 family